MWKDSALAGAQRLLAGGRRGRGARGRPDSVPLAGSRGSWRDTAPPQESGAPAQERNTIRVFARLQPPRSGPQTPPAAAPGSTESCWKWRRWRGWRLKTGQRGFARTNIGALLRLKPRRGPHVGGPDWSEPSDGGVFDLFTFASVISA